jgi:hypothetical protein
MSDPYEGLREAIDGAAQAAAEESGGGAVDQDDIYFEEPEAGQEAGQEPEESVATEAAEEVDHLQRLREVDWDALKIDELPVDKLPPKLAELRSQRDRYVSQQAESTRRLAEYEAKLAQYEKAPAAEPGPEPGAAPEPEDEDPEPVIEDEDFDNAGAFNAKLRQRYEWERRQTIKRIESNLSEKQKAKEAEDAKIREQVNFINTQAERIASKPEFSPEVEKRIGEMMTENPHWRALLGDEGGWDVLYERALHDVKASRVGTSQDLEKKTTARGREVPRRMPSSQAAVDDLEIGEDPKNISGRLDKIIGGYRGSPP